MIQFKDYISADHVCDLSSPTKDGVLSEICSLVSGKPTVENHEKLLADIRERETVMSTGIGSGIAIPHARTNSVSDFVIAVGRSVDGVDFESLDGQPVHLILLMGAPERNRDMFLELIAKIGSLFTRHGLYETFLKAGTPADMYRLIVENVDKFT